MKRLATWFLGALIALSLLAAPALAQQPLKIGFGMSLTGPLAGNGNIAPTREITGMGGPLGIAVY